MFISDSKFTSELDSTDVYVTQQFVCSNAKCPDYAGKDMKKPKKYKKIKDKVN